MAAGFVIARSCSTWISTTIASEVTVELKNFGTASPRALAGLNVLLASMAVNLLLVIFLMLKCCIQRRHCSARSQCCAACRRSQYRRTGSTSTRQESTAGGTASSMAIASGSAHWQGSGTRTSSLNQLEAPPNPALPVPVSVRALPSAAASFQATRAPMQDQRDQVQVEL